MTKGSVNKRTGVPQATSAVLVRVIGALAVNEAVKFGDIHNEVVKFGDRTLNADRFLAGRTTR